jgi:hypothetical protein
MVDKSEQIGYAMQQAWSRVKKAQSKMWGDWMLIGEGLMEGRRWAMEKANTNRPEGKGYILAFSEWLARFKVSDLDKSDRAKLLKLMEERPAVEEWRAGLEPEERRDLNHPVTVWRKWTAATKVKPKRKPGFSAAEHSLAAGKIQELESRVVELQEELESAREAEPTPAPADAGTIFGALNVLVAGKVVFKDVLPGQFDPIALTDLAKDLNDVAAELKRRAAKAKPAAATAERQIVKLDVEQADQTKQLMALDIRSRGE